MKFKYILASALMSVSLTSLAQSKVENPITKAMMEFYKQEFDAEPRNYEVYLRRANEYYNL